MQAVLSDPRAQLPVDNAKYVRNCAELHMAGQSITDLAGFEPFTNLEALWLNRNKLNRIEGLDACFRIRELYLHNNELDTLEGSLQTLKFLDRLSLANNRLRNLDVVLGYLLSNPHLTQLDMSGNPVAEENDYRLRVLGALPSLIILDNHKVTDDERRRARRFRRSRGRPRGRVAKKPRNAPTLPPPVQDLSGCALLLDRESRRIRARRSREEEAERLAMFQASATRPSGADGKGAADPTVAPRPRAQQVDSARARTAWRSTFLQEAFAARDPDGNGLGRKDVARVLSDVRDYGIAVAGGAGAGGPDEAVEAVLQALGADTEPVTFEPFRAAVEGEKEGLPPLHFAPLSPAELVERADQLYARARKLRDEASRVERERGDALLAKALRLTQRAGSLEADAGTHTNASPTSTSTSTSASAGSSSQSLPEVTTLRNDPDAKRRAAERRASRVYGDSVSFFPWSDVKERKREGQAPRRRPPQRRIHAVHDQPQ